jgi:hypothetical protein
VSVPSETRGNSGDSGGATLQGFTELHWRQRKTGQEKRGLRSLRPSSPIPSPQHSGITLRTPGHSPSPEVKLQAVPRCQLDQSHHWLYLWVGPSVAWWRQPGCWGVRGAAAQRGSLFPTLHKWMNPSSWGRGCKGCCLQRKLLSLVKKRNEFTLWFTEHFQSLPPADRWGGAYYVPGMVPENDTHSCSFYFSCLMTTEQGQCCHSPPFLRLRKVD